jgi:hypothetical protein
MRWVSGLATGHLPLPLSINPFLFFTFGVSDFFTIALAFCEPGPIGLEDGLGSQEAEKETLIDQVTPKAKARARRRS